MTTQICRYDDCTGCAACASACPAQCIDMVPDNEGFLRPSINESRCIRCGKCKQICPAINYTQDDGKEPACFASRISDMQIRSLSSSGGLFTAFAQQILSKSGVVFAAGFDDSNQVIHKSITDISKLDELRRSKYVQSRIGSCYNEVRSTLETGKEVLFCGTPCQVGGLKAFLGNEYQNLYTVDFICHGVPSPLAWEKYLEYQQETRGSVINSISFRSKKNGWKLFSMKLSFQDGVEYEETVADDYYLRSFIMDLDLRLSCYNCKFKQIHRVSDITIADFWGVEKHVPAWDDDTGVSLTLIHSEKGMRLYDSCLHVLESRPIPFNAVAECNPAMTVSVKKSPLRKAFMRDVRSIRFDKLHNKYCGSGLASKIRRKIAQFVKV